MQQWEMSEIFTFPKHLGNVLAKSKIEVIPKWHEELNEDSVMLRGIYVLKGNIQFDHVAREEDLDEGIYIEHIDIEKDYGYFEYALPFAVDFPNDDIESITLRINEVKIEPNNGCCLCSWDVHCDIEKKVQAIKEVVEVEEIEQIEQIEAIAEPNEQPVVEEVHPVQLQQETSPQLVVSEELDFLEQLADAYSSVKITLKK